MQIGGSPRIGMVAMQHSDEQFVSLLIGIQPRLYGFILSLLPDRNEADDVLQRANVVLLRKQQQFVPGTSFDAWARRVAMLEVQGYRKEFARERARFSDALVAQLAEETEHAQNEPDDLKTALRQCLDNLGGRHRKLIERRYSGTSVSRLAEQAQKSVAAVSQELYRIRARLAECISRRMSNQQW